MNALIIADKIDDINFDLLYKGGNYNGLRGGAIIRMNQCPREGRRPPGNQGAGAGCRTYPRADSDLPVLAINDALAKCVHHRQIGNWRSANLSEYGTLVP